MATSEVPVTPAPGPEGKGTSESPARRRSWVVAATVWVAKLRPAELAMGLALGALVGLLMRDLDLPALVSYGGQREPLVAAIAVLGALLWLTRVRWVLSTSAAALVLLWVVVAFTPLSSLIAAGLPRWEAAGPADAIFVSAAGLPPDADQSRETRSRLLSGVELLARGRSKLLIVAEPERGGFAAAARELMDLFGVKAELLVAGPARNTHEEALAVASLARKRGLRLLLVVTSPLHSRRASAVLEHEGVAVISVPSLETRFELEALNRPGDRLGAFGTVLHERIGLWVYRWRGWVS
jgi:uncharacterized SAM-binding protein YcdF (DUF218 family)